MTCHHAWIVAESSPGEVVIEAGDDIELCYTPEIDVLVFDFEGHEGGGIVIGPEGVKKLRNLLNASPE